MPSRFLVPAVAVAAFCLSLSAAETKAEQQSASDRAARVFITDSQSWAINGISGGSAEGFGAKGGGGARPQTAEIMKTFGERCPTVTINNKQEKADYVVLLDHEGGKEVVSRDNKVVVFNRDGDSIMSRSTRILGNAVKDACSAIAADWPKQVNRMSNSGQNANGTVPETAARN